MEVAILLWLFCAAIGAAIAKSKNRHWSEGLLLGGLLGVIGVIIELFMRSQPPGAPPPGWYPDPESNGNQRFWNGAEWTDLRPVRSNTTKAVEGSAPTKKCPDCAETILAAAKVCKHCGYRFAAPSARQEPQTAPRGKTVKVRCHHCQHVQSVAQSAATFDCEKCGTKLKRRTADA